MRLPIASPASVALRKWMPPCTRASETSRTGRTGIYELMTVDDNIRRMVHDVAAEQQLRQYAMAQGTVSLREDGIRWVAAGETTLEEVLRVTREG